MNLLTLSFPDSVCEEKNIYFRTNGSFAPAGARPAMVRLKDGERLSSYTYMNVFDMGFWRKYSCIKKFMLTLCVQGAGIVRICVRKGDVEKLFKEEELNGGTYETDISAIEDGLVFFCLKARGDLAFKGGAFFTPQEAPNEVYIAVNTVTYHRNEELRANLHTFTKSFFFDEKNAFYGRLKIYITDNGDDFAPEETGASGNLCINSLNEAGALINICRNSNKGGGSGGFARGISEIKKDAQNFPATHIVFMDDDVLFQQDSFGRLFAFLSFVREEYRDNPVAGRMFDADNRNIQYTAAEVWNGGELVHMEASLDMSLSENVLEEAQITGDYGGWWLCAYPALFLFKNAPYPFFLHCDDCEMGLRCARETLVLRGFQVWHETWDKKLTPKTAYYDARNSFILNMMENDENASGENIRRWRALLDFYHNEGRRKEKYFCALALWHASRPGLFQKTKGELLAKYEKLSQNRLYVKLAAPGLRRAAQRRMERRYGAVRQKYLEIRVSCRRQQ